MSNEDIKTLVVKERWRRRWVTNNLLNEAGEHDPTKVLRPDRTKVVQHSDLANADTYVSPKKPDGPRLVGPEDERPPPESSAHTDSDKWITRDKDGKPTGPTELGKAAIKIDNIWKYHLALLVSYQTGKQLSSQIGQKLAQQTGVDPGAAEKIAAAVMKQVLEHLEEIVTDEIKQAIPDLFA